MGGGGGSSGKVGYAYYIEDIHEVLLGGYDLLDPRFLPYGLQESLALVINNNPYETQAAYSPDTVLDVMDTRITAFEAVSDTLIADTAIEAEVAAYDVEATRRLDDEVIPKYNTLMRDICAVQSTTFVVGRALLLEGKTRDVNTYEAKLRLEWKKIYVQAEKDILTVSIDVNRMKIAAKHDEEQRDSEIEVLDANWNLDTLNSAGQFLGILGGGSMIPNKPNKTKSAIAGGMAGAATGAYMGAQMGAGGGPYGAIIGGVLGAAASFL